MRSRPFAQVDVFSSTPYLGNPVAVILDASGLDADDMQRVARWTNLSETTFITPPTHSEADYRVRIFTPNAELPFAGHPTLGSAHAWLEHGGIPRGPGSVMQECEAGLITVRREAGRLSFAAPPRLRSGAIDGEELARAAAALGLRPDQVVAHQWVDNGPGWCVIEVASAQEVLALEPDLSALPTGMIGVIGAYPPGSPFAYEMRTFAPAVGVAEDPACGSMNASVGQWLISSGKASRSYRVSQGQRLGRSGEIVVSADDDGTVWVGGGTHTLFRGSAQI
jgi:PhzF family phenazine biosynthesis protein